MSRHTQRISQANDNEASIEGLMSVKAEDKVEEESDKEKANARTHEDL